MTKPDDTQVNPRKRKATRVAWHGLRTVWLLACLPVLFAFIAAALMINRDITAPSWVTNRIEARAAEILGGGTLSFGDITMNVGTDLHPRVRLRDTILRDANGAVLARIPSVSGLVSPRGLLFDRAALVQEVVLSGAQLDLRRNADGSVAITFDRGGTDAGQAESLQGLLTQMDAIFARPTLAALEQVSVTGLVINYADARAGRAWTVDGGQLDLDVRGETTKLRADLTVLSGGAVGGVTFNFESPQDRLDAGLEMTITDLPARDIATQSPALAWLSAIDAPMSAKLTTRIAGSGVLSDLQTALSLGAGTLDPGGEATPVRFDGADVALTFSPQQQRLQFHEISLRTEWGDLHGQGQAFAQDIRDGLPDALIGQFAFPALSLNPVGAYDAPVSFGDVAVDLRLTLAPFEVEVGQAVLTHDATKLVMRGQAKAATDGWQMAIDLHAGAIHRDQIFELWPVAVTPGMRGWFETNLTAALIKDLRLGWRKTPGDAARLAGHSAFEQTDLRIFKRINPIEGGRGQISLIDNRFVLTLAEGATRAPQSGNLDFAGSIMSIPDVRIKNAPMELDLRIDSTITGVLSVLDQPPFGFLSRANIPVAVADGRAETVARLRFPLKNPVPKDEFEYEVTAGLQRVMSDVLIRGRKLEGTGLTMEADNAQLSIAGPVRVDGVPVRGTWTQILGQQGSQVSAEIDLSQDALATFGVALPPGTVNGQGRGELRLDLRRGAAPAFRLTSDLRGIGLALPQVGVRKPPGDQGYLEAAGRLSEPPSIDTLVLRGGGLSADGRIELTPEGQLAAARFTRVQVGNWLDAPVTLRGRGRGRPVGVEVAGGLLDLRRARFGPPSGGEGGPIEVALDRLQVTEGLALRGFRGSFSSTGGLAGQFTARVNDGPGVRGTVAPQNGRTALRIQSDDAGGAVRAAGFLKNGVGGALDLRLLPAAQAGDFDGFLAIRDIRVKDAPAMAALLDAISVVGLLQQLDGQGLAFEDVDARFRLTPTQVVVTQASAVGPGLGISLDGIYTLASKTFDFQGVVSPFYLINSIGSVLTRRGEGLIGFNFTITGSGSAPDVAVNPLSAFTPGMFRDIFRRPPPQVSP